MRPWLTFMVGAVAKIVGIVATTYADWLLDKLTDGTSDGWSLLRDLKAFWRRLLRLLAGALTNRRREYQDYEAQDWSTDSLSAR